MDHQPKVASNDNRRHGRFTDALQALADISREFAADRRRARLAARAPAVSGHTNASPSRGKNL
jgi:hypothetical protein